MPRRAPSLRAAALSLLALACVATWSGVAHQNSVPRSLALWGLAMVLMVEASGARRWRVPLPAALLAGWILLSEAIHRAAPHTVSVFLDGTAALVVVMGVSNSRLPRATWLRACAAIILLGVAVGLVEQFLSVEWNAVARPAGLFASRTTAATLATMAIPLVAALTSRRPALTLLSTALLAGFIVTTRSRTAWALLPVISLASMAVLPGRRRWQALGLAVGVVSALAFTPGPRLRWVTERPYARSLETMQSLDWGDRAWVLKESVRLLGDPVALVGHGPGSFEFILGDAVTEVPASLRGVRIESPHFEALRLALEWGAWTLPCFLWLLWPTQTRHRMGRHSRAVWLSLAAAAAISCTQKTFTEVPTLAVCAVMTGLLWRSRGRHLPRAVALPFVALALLWTGRLQVESAMSSRALQQAAEPVPTSPSAAWKSLETRLPLSSDFDVWLFKLRLLETVHDERRCTQVLLDARVLFGHQPTLSDERCR